MSRLARGAVGTRKGFQRWGQGSCSTLSENQLTPFPTAPLSTGFNSWAVTNPHLPMFVLGLFVCLPVLFYPTVSLLRYYFPLPRYLSTLSEKKGCCTEDWFRIVSHILVSHCTRSLGLVSVSPRLRSPFCNYLTFACVQLVLAPSI